MKGKIIAAVCVLLLFIPTVLAIVSYNSAVNHPVDRAAISKMVITDVDGATFTFERGAEKSADELGGDMIAFFVDMTKEASRTDSLPAAVSANDYYEVSYFSYNLETKYRYYFTTDPSDAWMTDNHGAAYRIKRDTAEQFISSMYAVSLYKAAAAPVMTLAAIAVICGTVAVKTFRWE